MSAFQDSNKPKQTNQAAMLHLIGTKATFANLTIWVSLVSCYDIPGYLENIYGLPTQEKYKEEQLSEQTY